MKNSRRAFAWLEFLLVIAIFALLAAVFVPATIAIKERAREDMIISQLSQITKAGQKYISEKGLKKVDYKTLIDAGAIKPFESVAGEKYDDVSILSEGGSISVKTAKGKEVFRQY